MSTSLYEENVAIKGYLLLSVRLLEIERVIEKVGMTFVKVSA